MFIWFYTNLARSKGDFKVSCIHQMHSPVRHADLLLQNKAHQCIFPRYPNLRYKLSLFGGRDAETVIFYGMGFRVTVIYIYYTHKLYIYIYISSLLQSLCESWEWIIILFFYQDFAGPNKSECMIRKRKIRKLKSL